MFGQKLFIVKFLKRFSYEILVYVNIDTKCMYFLLQSTKRVLSIGFFTDLLTDTRASWAWSELNYQRGNSKLSDVPCPKYVILAFKSAHYNSCYLITQVRRPITLCPCSIRQNDIIYNFCKTCLKSGLWWEYLPAKCRLAKEL